MDPNRRDGAGHPFPLDAWDLAWWSMDPVMACRSGGGTLGFGDGWPERRGRSHDGDAPILWQHAGINRSIDGHGSR